MLVSFIVPLYNYGRFIARCLDSLVDQGLDADDYEILVIDDGSTDNGPEIVREYCHRHPAIRLITQENAGAGVARNRGIDEAKGEYLQFVDADDTFALKTMGAFREIVEEARKPFDILVTSFREVGPEYITEEVEPINIDFSGNTTEYVAKYGLHPLCFRQIIRAEFLRKSNLRFNNYRVGEDMQLMLRCFSQTDARVLRTTAQVYNYYQHADSAIHTMSCDKAKTVASDYAEIYRDIANGRLVSNCDKQQVEAFVTAHLRVRLITFLLKVPLSYGEIRRILKDLRRSGVLPLPYIPNLPTRVLGMISRSPLAMLLAGQLYRKKK